jgi:SAM-dependent methyltransferase
MSDPGSAGARWRRDLAAWTIPDAILAAAPEPPYAFPAELFRRRAERAATGAQPTPTTERAEEALPAGGEVLDIGCGAGATSLALAQRARVVTGVDESDGMLESLAAGAAAADVASVTVRGRWPDVADEVGPADVVVCGHVLYNVADPVPFVAALDAHARRRVVLELTERHPWAWMRDLWQRFHGLDRPDGPTADDAIAVLREGGFGPVREDRLSRPGGGGGFARREDAVALVRRRLCLTAERDPEIETALGDRLVRDADGAWSAGPERHLTVTLWWDRRG